MSNPQTRFEVALVFRRAFAALALLATLTAGSVLAGQPEPLTIVVMDPLSKPLACDCVQGYAQRKYEHLGSYLQLALDRPVKVFWSESLEDALKEKSEGRADLIIGKHSVVLAGAKQAKLKVQAVAQLTDSDGMVTQSGLIVVRKDDPAKSVKDLTGYRIFFGPADCDEKSAAPMKLLKDSGVKLPKDIEVSDACSTACKDMMALPADAKAAAVISSYAQPLLEGCGTIEKGDLRVIGESEKVPFITAFVNTVTIKGDDRTALVAALLKVSDDVDLLIHLETGLGFVAPEGAAKPAESRGGSKKKAG